MDHGPASLVPVTESLGFGDDICQLAKDTISQAVPSPLPSEQNGPVSEAPSSARSFMHHAPGSAVTHISELVNNASRKVV